MHVQGIWGFDLWQPHRVNIAPMAGTTVLPSHKSPLKGNKIGSCHSEKNKWRKCNSIGREVGGRGELAKRNLVARKHCMKETLTICHRIM